jgi:uncharacterized membrane protein YeaQ/YmgE (transglycosylase-associated protein family)
MRFRTGFIEAEADALITEIVAGAETVTRERKGFGILRNLGVGLVGALVGGLVFRVFGIFPGLDRVVISLRDVVAALIGSLLVLAVIWLWQRIRKSE